MSPRTKTEKLDDARMWRKLVSLTHPDRDGDSDLFIWVRELQQAVESGRFSSSASNACAGGCRREAQARAEGRAEGRAEAERRSREQATKSATNAKTSQQKTQNSSDRVPFPGDPGADFEKLTSKALSLADEVEQPFARLLRLLSDCEPSEMHETEQSKGASYKSLAALGHRVGMSKATRVKWYRVAESVPLAQRHVGHMLAREEG